jgi:hypothetical protein
VGEVELHPPDLIRLLGQLVSAAGIDLGRGECAAGTVTAVSFRVDSGSDAVRTPAEVQPQ